jgi:hypothetical protein
MLREPSALVHPAKICPNMRRIRGCSPYHSTHLPADAIVDSGKTGGVVARMRETCDRTAADRIDDLHEHSWHDARRRPARLLRQAVDQGRRARRSAPVRQQQLRQGARCSLPTTRDGRRSEVPRFVRHQYSSANMIVITRSVTDGSEGSGEW